MIEIGPRLQRLRLEHHLSQRRLAKSAGVSNATVSLIESGRSDPSLGLLKRLLDVMGVSFSDFFADGDSAPARYFFRRDELHEISSGAIRYRQVGSNLSGSRLQILHERYAPGADTGRSMLSHEAEEGGIIVSGCLEVTVAGQSQILGTGDAYRFNSRLPHRFRNPGREQCVLVSACTPPSF